VRVALLALAALLAVPATAVANHQPDTGYEGEVTTGQGGIVGLNVSEDGSTVDASFQNIGNLAGTCTGVSFSTGEVPITNHAFSFSGNGGQVTANGSFGPSFAAGSAQVLMTPCTTGSQAWIVDGPDAYFDEAGAGRGHGILNDTGEDQIFKLGAKRGESEEYVLRFDNIGENSESYAIKGCKSSKGFAVSYKDANGGQTEAVTSGDYETEVIDPEGPPHELRLKIKAKKSAKKGKTKTCKVTQESDRFVDVLKARLEVN